MQQKSEAASTDAASRFTFVQISCDFIFDWDRVSGNYCRVIVGPRLNSSIAILIFSDSDAVTTFRRSSTSASAGTDLFSYSSSRFRLATATEQSETDHRR